jgi:hypothetical protein
VYVVCWWIWQRFQIAAAEWIGPSVNAKGERLLIDHEPPAADNETGVEAQQPLRGEADSFGVERAELAAAHAAAEVAGRCSLLCDRTRYTVHDAQCTIHSPWIPAAFRTTVSLGCSSVY